MFKNREIKENTKRIAFGTNTLSLMPEKNFIFIYKKMEKQGLKAEDYEIPNWFNIRFIPEEKDIYQFVGSFNDGNGYPLVYKKDFLRILTRLEVKYEQIHKAYSLLFTFYLLLFANGS